MSEDKEQNGRPSKVGEFREDWYINKNRVRIPIEFFHLYDSFYIPNDVKEIAVWTYCGECGRNKDTTDVLTLFDGENFKICKDYLLSTEGDKNIITKLI